MILIHSNTAGVGHHRRKSMVAGGLHPNTSSICVEYSLPGKCKGCEPFIFQWEQILRRKKEEKHGIRVKYTK